MNVQKAMQITPPRSFTSQPPTPPASHEKVGTSISQILAVIKGRKEGYRLPAGKHWLRFLLEVHQYADLQRQLRETNLWDYHEDVLRGHDYFPLDRLYVIRMPSPLHETISSYISQELLRQLGVIAHSSSPSASFARNVENRGSADIRFVDTKYGVHQPDASFQHFEAQYPGVILEVSYSQKKKDLARLADDYILGSDADIRVVIGIDVEYKGSKKASVSVWRPCIEVNEVGEKELCVVQTVSDELFRDELGNLVVDSSASLQLRLEDFGSEAFAMLFEDLTQHIHISTETLLTFLERAEVSTKRMEQREGVARETKPWARKRGREKTPQEQLDSDREGRFVEQEQRASKKAMMDDSSYKTSSSDAEE